MQILDDTGQTCMLEMLEQFRLGGIRMKKTRVDEEKYELHLSFASKADRDWMAQIIKDHLLVLSEKVE
jgi:hypothetical protein